MSRSRCGRRYHREFRGGQADSEHLTLRRTGDRVMLQVFAQHLYLDVKAHMEDFLKRLSSDGALQKLVEDNGERLMQSATIRATRGLEERDFIALGM